MDQKKTQDFGEITRKWHAEYGNSNDSEPKLSKHSQLDFHQPKLSQMSEAPSSRIPSKVPSDLVSNIDERVDLETKLKAISFGTPITQASIVPGVTKSGFVTMGHYLKQGSPSHQRGADSPDNLKRSDGPEKGLLEIPFLSQQNLKVDLRFGSFESRSESPGGNTPVPKSNLVTIATETAEKIKVSEDNR